MARRIAGQRSRAGRIAWIRKNFFRYWYDAVLTLTLVAVSVLIGGKLFRWALLDAAFVPVPEACRTATGACWSIIVDMWPVFLVGLYPEAERWRILLGLVVIGIAAASSQAPGLRRAGRRIAIWSIAMIVFLVLIHGGAFGLAVVESNRWGGLLLTVILAISTQTIAFPVGVALALARRAKRASTLQAAATIYIELMRSVPLVMVLLMTTLVLPLFLPPATPLNNVVTSAIGITLFSAAAIAEVVRGGLIGVPESQGEAARSLGLTYRQSMRLVVLPQALRRIQPALVGTFITFVKGSTLVVAIGLYDLLGGAILASTNPRWIGHALEPLVFVSFVFWVLCFTLSRYSRRLERRHSRQPETAAGSQRAEGA